MATFTYLFSGPGRAILASCVSVYLGHNSMSFDLYVGLYSSKVMVGSQSVRCISMVTGWKIFLSRSYRYTLRCHVCITLYIINRQGEARIGLPNVHTTLTQSRTPKIIRTHCIINHIIITSVNCLICYMMWHFLYIHKGHMDSIVSGVF